MVGICLLVVFCSVSLYAIDPTEIVRKADARLRGTSSRAEMTMKIIRPEWTRELSLKSWSKGDTYSLILVTAPARDEGTAFLKRRNEVWQWVPSIQRVVKIPSSMMSQSWMGSDFTNEDLVRESSVVNDFRHNLIGDTTIDEQSAYVIELIPKPDAPVIWERIVMVITKNENIERRVEYYGEEDELINTMTLYDIKKVGGRTIPTTWELVPADKNRQKTLMQYKSIEFNIPIDEAFFSLQNLRRIR